ncbi:lipase member I-like isoform X2 [Neocloeon triangulifer]|uniref:lipase member I-like isoform X2 n=1 Tax=Neocloeon triangulifer TaxID=2078957 RepID=UPI00286F8014|nr:lipase member I-like isoform X2 [Neocloeon triangulifer]
MNRLCTLFTFAAATFFAVEGAPSRELDVQQRAWIVFPGETETAHLAMLSHPVNKPRLLQPNTDVTFHLYTRSNPDLARQIWVGNVDSAPFDPSKETKFLIHGFGADALSPWIIGVKNALLERFDCNVVSVDWSVAAQGPLYNEARANAAATGEHVGAMYAYLDGLGQGVDGVHCVGFSLGAHVCGFSGKAVGGALGRVTALDPALPLFALDAPEARLATSDAAYVDVVHTCAGWLGFDAPIGHADFYPNGGASVQPGCATDVTGHCSQHRAAEFFVESINSNNFIGRECASWSDFQNGLCDESTRTVMGFSSDPSTRGTFFLVTAETAPFALG